jgi:hypothetical protein
VIEVEQEKKAEHRGKLLHPVEAGQPRETGISHLITSKLETVAERRTRGEQAA